MWLKLSEEKGMGRLSGDTRQRLLLLETMWAYGQMDPFLPDLHLKDVAQARQC